MYKYLGVQRDSDSSTIKKAYKRLSLEFHPDKNRSPEAPAMFQKINTAYEVTIINLYQSN